MKFAYTMLSILVALFIVSGCSEEKPENYENKTIVRKIIRKPVKKVNEREEPKKEITDIVSEDTDVQAPMEAIKEPPAPIEEANIYTTKDGDTLSDISARTDVYNNPVKWPILYRYNPEAFSSIKDKEHLYDAILPAGIRLKIVPKEEVEKNLESRPGYYYVANLISSPSMKEIVPQIVKLMDEGHFVYISTAMVDGKEWYRLRAGFFKTRSEANIEGDKIRIHLKIPDIWTAKIGDEEFHEFGGY